MRRSELEASGPIPAAGGDPACSGAHSCGRRRLPDGSISTAITESRRSSSTRPGSGRSTATSTAVMRIWLQTTGQFEDFEVPDLVNVHELARCR